MRAPLLSDNDWIKKETGTLHRTEFFTTFFPMNQDGAAAHPTDSEIAIYAYLIWEKEGRPEGRSREHWLQAETQLMITRAHDEWTGNRPQSLSLS